tara:strand:- start:86 stop:322 length:237 start_codon:yes stop_codon:yes gene_type:complete
MSEQEWFSIPGFSAYEINRDGDVRISLERYPEDKGELLHCYTSEGTTKTVHWYLLNTDGGNGPRAAHKDYLLLQVFGE